MNDDLGDRMKGYEGIAQSRLPRRTNLILRADGRSFHTYARNCQRPFDTNLMAAMDETALALCREIQGAKLAYVQSDEITIWATDYDDLSTQPWFGGNLQKVVSVGASVATAAFNDVRLTQLVVPAQAHFDCRAFTISELAEVANCFLWRCQDASRNSLQMVARAHYSHKALEGKNSADLHNLLHEKGVNWNDFPPGQKRGRVALYSDIGWIIGPAMDHTFAYWNGLVTANAPKESPQ